MKHLFRQVEFQMLFLATAPLSFPAPFPVFCVSQASFHVSLEMYDMVLWLPCHSLACCSYWNALSRLRKLSTKQFFSPELSGFCNTLTIMLMFIVWMYRSKTSTMSCFFWFTSSSPFLFSLNNLSCAIQHQGFIIICFCLFLPSLLFPLDMRVKIWVLTTPDCLTFILQKKESIMEWLPLTSTKNKWVNVVCL